MMYRSDLALEAVDSFGSKIEGLLVREEKEGPITMTVVEVLSQEASQQIGKPLGKYCTLQLPPFSDDTDRNGQGAQAAAHILREMLPEKGEVLVMGLGNRSLTADALGPKAADRILATRHIEKELRRIAGLERVRPVSVCSPGVLGMTGLETREILLALVRQIQPAAVIAIDALAAADLNRMGCTVQITDSGIAPGSGVGNHRPQLNRETIGVPVIGVGVPTVMDGMVLASQLFSGNKSGESKEVSVTVTVREIDLLIARAASLLAMAVNQALNPEIEEHWFRELTE